MADLLDTMTGSAGLISGHTPDSGASGVWIPVAAGGIGGDIRLSGAGTAYGDSGAGTQTIYKAAWTPSGADYTFTLKYTKFGNAGELGGFARFTGTVFSDFTGYGFRYSTSAGAVQLWKAVSASFSALGTPYSFTLVDGDVISLTVAGTALTVKVNGTSRVTATDSDISGAGTVALWQDDGASGVGTGVHIDQLNAGDPVAAGATSFTLSGPSAGKVNTATSNYTVTPNAAVSGSNVFAPTAITGVTFAPTTLTWTDGQSGGKTFTVTATTTGVKTVNGSFNTALTPPADVSTTIYDLTLLPSSQTVAVGVAASLTADLTPTGALTAATDGAGTLSTATPTDGVAFTLTKNGATTETVTVSGPGGTSATATVTGTLTPVVSGTNTVDQGATTTLTASNFTGGTVTWSSGSTGIATVNASTGVVTGVAHGFGTSQTSVITATGVANPAQTATRTVTVAAVGISVSPSSVSVAVADTTTLTGTVTGSTTTTKSWASDDTGVATVNGSGVVTGVATGTCTITATATADSDATDTCVVTVADVADRLLAANFGTANAGLATVGYTLYDPDGIEYQARTTTGVSELGTDTGCYGASVSLPSTWTGYAVWDTGGGSTKHAIQTV